MAVLGGLLGMTPAAAAATPPLFGTVEFRVDSLAALPQWQRVLRQIERERPVYRLCAAGGERMPDPQRARLAGDAQGPARVARRSIRCRRSTSS